MFGWLSLTAALFVLGLKGLAYLLTGSVSLLSDAAESLVNVVAGVSLLVALRIAGMPPDLRHPYGHHKAEYLSAALEAAMIILAGGLIAASAVRRLLDPQPLDQLPLGLALGALATFLNLGLVVLIRRAAQRRRSPALAANATHLETDVWTSVSVLLAVLAVAISGWQPLDPLIALAVAASIARRGLGVLAESTSNLLDARLPAGEEELILAVLDAHSEVQGYHRLYTRRSGPARFAEVDIFVDPQLTVEEAHDLVVEIEDQIHARLANLLTTIHVEPVKPGVREGGLRPEDEFTTP